MVDIDPTIHKTHTKSVNLEINDKDSPESPAGLYQEHKGMVATAGLLFSQSNKAKAAIWGGMTALSVASIYFNNKH